MILASKSRICGKESPYLLGASIISIICSFVTRVTGQPNHEFHLVVVINFLTILGLGMKLGSTVLITQDANSARLATCPSAESTLRP